MPLRSTSGSYGSAIHDFAVHDADWTNPEDLAKCAQWIFSMRDLKRDLERRTARNIAFLEGKQHYEWDWRRREMRLPDYKRDRLLLVNNIIKLLMTQRAAKMSRQDSAWSVPAYTSDEYDQVVARFSNDVMRWYWEEGLNMPRHVLDLIMWMDVSPLCFIHPHWNPTAGDPVTISPEDMMRPIPLGTPPEIAAQMAAEDIERFQNLRGFNENTGVATQYTGDIGFSITNIFNTMWYPFFVEDMAQVHIVLKSDVMPVEDVMHRYGVDKETVLRHRESPLDLNRYGDAMSRWRSPFVESPDQYSAMTSMKGVLVHQLFVDAKLAPPFGASAVVLGGSHKSLVWGRLGNKYAQMPFLDMVETKTPGTMWGTCPVDDLISPQVEINLALNQQYEWRNQILRPRVIRIKGDGADDTAFRADTQDAVIEVMSDQYRPSILSIPPSAASFENQSAIQLALRFMQDSSAIPDVTLGRTEDSDVRSGVGVRSLQEEAQERLRIVGGKINRAMAWTGNFLLAELQDKAIYKRTAPLVGENNSIEWLTWSRAMLRPTVYAQMTHQTAIVRVTTFTNIPSTPIEARNTVIALAQLGILRPGVHDTVFANVFGMDDLKTTLDKRRADRDKQEREIQMWRAGQVVGPPSITDDHATHEEVLAAWLKSDEFDRLMRTRPDIALDARSHYDSHQQEKFNDVERMNARTIYAKMQVGAEYAQKAAAAGVPEWAAVFLAMSLGGIGPGNTAETGAPDGGQKAGSDGRPDQQRAAAGADAPTGRPGERPGAPTEGSENAATYGQYGDAAPFRRRVGPGKDGAGSNSAVLEGSARSGAVGG